MATYQNLPSINLELLDGNLIIDKQVEGPVQMVVGVAYSGPSNTQYLSSDSNAATNIYGADSPLIKKMAEAKLGGAQNVLLYRIGGSSAAIVDLFGENTLIGTVEQTSAAGTKYSIYIGADPAPLIAGDAGLILYEGDKVVYSNMVGTEVDLGLFSVVGFDVLTDVRIGTIAGSVITPVVFKDALGTISEESTLATGVTDAQVAYTMPAGTTAVSVVAISGGATETLIPGDGTTANTFSFDTDTLIVTFAPTAPLVALTDTLTFTYEGSVVEEGTETIAATSANQTDFALFATAIGVQSVTVDLTPAIYTFSTTGGVTTVVIDAALTPVGDESIVVNYTIADAITGAAYYQESEDNINATWEKYYELLDIAYADLETTIATHLVTDRARLDVENIADGSTATDRLSYLRKEEVEGVMNYHWSEDKTVYAAEAGGETPVLADAARDANGQPIVSAQYHEVNFAHQMGEWLHAITSNDTFVLGVIGTSMPVAFTTQAISKWLGTLPTRDPFNKIIADGSGLLGNKFMAGTTTRISGLFNTDSGFPDGNTLTDTNGAPIELGKYLSVTMGVGVTPNSSSLGTVAGAVNIAAAYSGLLNTIIAGDSTTNKILPQIAMPFALKKSKLNDLAYAGYVGIALRQAGTAVVSGELATSDNSDYDYVSTAIIIADVVGRIRDRLEPFIGKGLNDITLAAVDTAVESIFESSVKAGSIVKYAYQVLSDPQERGQGHLRIPITIVPAFELRQISVSIKLAYDI